jgi:hypothetical protein
LSERKKISRNSLRNLSFDIEEFYADAPNMWFSGLEKLTSQTETEPLLPHLEDRMFLAGKEKGNQPYLADSLKQTGVPKGIRTPVAGVKGLCPGPD